MSRKDNLKKAVLVAALSAGQVMLFSPMSAIAASSVGISGHPLFSVNAAGGLSAAARAAAIQRNLDNALVALQGHNATVAVTSVRGMPVVTLGGYHIITVDTNTAKSMHSTPSSLARMWANNLKTAILDTNSLSNHLATITGENTFAATVPNNTIFAAEPATTFVQLPVGLHLPVTLISGISARNVGPGAVVQARLSSNVTLPSGQVLPAGTLVIGHAVGVSAGSPLFGGPGTVQIAFDQMQLSDGTMLPISATVVGGIQSAQQTAMLGGLQSNTLGRVVTRGAVGAGLGAALGTGIGAIVAGASRRVSAGRGLGTGAWMGAAIGGGLGALSGLLVRPNSSLSFPAGQHLMLELNAPAQVAVQGGML